VTLDEIIAEVDSDKATFELPAEATGILRHVAKEGDVLEIGGLICKIEITEGAPAQTAAPSAPSLLPRLQYLFLPLPPMLPDMLLLLHPRFWQKKEFLLPPFRVQEKTEE
jgi:pyruvate/2-oxoglutarate dehydrogenase complex dihydrolipoamide acyltransferase (E2) component